MPIYEYRCESCEKDFSIKVSISKYEEGNVTCPECKGDKVIRKYSAFYAKTSKKS